MATKIDFKKTQKFYYSPPKKFEIIEIPDRQYLMIDGIGEPGGERYTNALEALYPAAYKIKFTSKVALERDYVVPPLEGLWWADDMNAFIRRDKSVWKWTMMIMVPDWITKEMYQTAVSIVGEAKNPISLNKLRLESYHEGLSVQILHLGSYEDETPVLADLHNNFIPNNNLKERGHHHEVYLSDPRRVAPEKLKTVLRQPVDRL
jgi:hypothetical protein